MITAMIIWALIGAYFNYKAELIQQYAFHMKYTLTHPVVGSPLTEGYCTFWMFLIPTMLMGPLAILFIPLSASYLPKDVKIKDAWNAEVGKAYRVEPLTLIIAEIQQKIDEHFKNERPTDATRKH